MNLKNINLLLVDDEEDLLAIFSDLFEMEVAQVFSAQNGSEALNILKQNKIDIVISDNFMPEMTGPELLTAIKLDDQLSPLFYFSTGDVDFTEKSVLELGAEGLFEKPFELEEIVEILNQKISTLDKVA